MQLAVLSKRYDDFCNLFGDKTSKNLVDIATGRAALKATETYILSTLQREAAARKKFKDERDKNAKYFLQPMKRTRVSNFAVENLKKTPPPHLHQKPTKEHRQMLRI